MNDLFSKPDLRLLRRLKRWQILTLIFALCFIFIYLWYQYPSSSQFVTVAVKQGNVSSSIVTTGTLNPVATVQVGTNVSGTIQTLYCDFNTKVKAGQLCAKIDPQPYQVAYDQAAANLASAIAQQKKDYANYVYAEINYKRDHGLLKTGVVSQDTVDLDKSTLDQAAAQNAVNNASIRQKQAALDAAKVNLDYTNIVSPVNGTVVSRSIDVGQTVAASFQTPTLFLIAKDLTKMQVDTNVSESDVGAARPGQKATFTVEAYPDRIFEGQVAQVRQAPISVQNVVTYDVVIATNNPDLILLPGMTANTRIITNVHDNVLLVPIQALRFSLSGRSGEEPSNESESSQQHIFVLRHGIPVKVPVTTGLSDGVNVEISGNGIQAGDMVIVNEIKSGNNTNTAPQRSILRF